ncbi:unnamed protein product [Paramecium octaurelia]|uniref:Uncharacterized protein n=1 Tax=Paramecium octaurelia TaxID=43137 RepID=A0A8S1SVB7_PAROT|nr:unnamed protein product [Paramecium octaurelia]
MAQFHKGFTWTQCKSTLKTKNTFINLRQTVTPNQGPVLLKIDTERELKYTNDLGWNWHKSWNIPNISVKISLQNEECTQWINCQVQLLAVKLLQNDLFEEVGLEGTTQYDIIDGKAFFSGVKFNSTTYNHQGHRFQLLILLKERENIILGLQSPPVFVDSRKSARDEHRQIQYIQPFEPNYLERNFCKKEKHFNDVVDAPIENNENGLHNYLTAPNIRNKIKHPLFMALKFSRCLNIYYQNNLETDNYLIEFQKQLMSKYQQSQYIIVFQSNNNRIRKKIEESLTQLFGQSMISVVERKYLDETQFKKLEFSSDDYSSIYPQLQELMNQYSQDQFNQSVKQQQEQEQQQEQQQDMNIEEEQQQQQQQQSIQTEQPIQQQLPKILTHSERKSAFTKYLDKLPTKNFEEEKQEQSKRMEKLNNIREMEHYDKVQKLVKVEEELIQNRTQYQQQFQQQQQQLQQQSYAPINSFSILLQQKLQEQILQYYFIQQQLMLLQKPPSV